MSPDAATLAQWGLPGLFLVAVVAGSVLAAPSEARAIESGVTQEEFIERDTYLAL